MTDRTQVRRAADRGRYDEATIRAILAEGLVAHVGVVTTDGPVVIPMTYGVDERGMLIHGSVASRLMRTRDEVCATVTIVDGLVLARSLFESSMNYRSVVVFGVPVVLEGEEKHAALLALSDSLFPGRLGHARPPSDKEARATTIWRLPLDAASAKVRSGPPVDLPEDLDLPYWGGVVDLRLMAGEPVPDGVGTVVDVPEHVRAMAALAGRGGTASRS